MNAQIATNMHELELHCLEQVSGGGEYNWNVWYVAPILPIYPIGYTIGYLANS